MSSTVDTPIEYTTGPSNLNYELTRLFGFESFNGRQEDVIRQVMSSVDTLAVMPTGAGKSLCYQLPSMLLPGTTLVISPLIALMKDQYDSLPADVYERTTFINSSLEAEELSQRMAETVAGKYKLVYCAPERLRQQPFVEALRRANISLLVVDEAHCVSMWGHDFRPDYLFIGKCLPLLGHPILLALTATATPEMRNEISTQLGRDLKPVVASVFRPNLYYEVEEMDDKEQKLRRLVEVCKAERGSGVVYARSRETCEQLAMMLHRAGVQAAHYHAGLPAEERSRTQEAFMLDRVRVIVATIAFGMGIDKSNVRFIIHFNPPDSLESYIQESGRAGRDGRPARCLLFISSGDKANITRWKRQEQLKVEELRAIYKEIARQVPIGATGIINMEQLEKQSSEYAGKTLDGTQVRVGMSLLERAGMIVRHPDAPRYVQVSLTHPGQAVNDPDFTRFVSMINLTPGQYARRETLALSDALQTPPHLLERQLLGWETHGWLQYKGDWREPLVERLQPPEDAAGAINRLLEQMDRAQQHRIAQMLDYAFDERCRHQMLAAHLGEQIEECGTSCDFCAPPTDRPQSRTEEVPDIPNNPGQVIIECLASFPFKVGKPSLVKALTGSAASNIRADRVKHFGALAGARPSSVEKAIDRLVEEGYLSFFESEGGYRLLGITHDGSEGVPRGVIELKSKKSKAKTRRGTQERSARDKAARLNPALIKKQESDAGREPTPEEADLFERLRAWRRAEANQQNLPPFMIFHDKTLWAIAMTRPSTPDELLSVKGVGRNHVEKYGSSLLELVEQS